MEGDGTFGFVVTKGQGQDVFLGDADMGQLWQAFEAKALVVARVADENAPSGSEGFESAQPSSD